MRARLCDYGDCTEDQYLYGRCRKHLTQLSYSERSEIEMASRAADREREQRRKSVNRTSAATSFGVALAAATLAMGGGALGVIFVAGAVAGVRFLFED